MKKITCKCLYFVDVENPKYNVVKYENKPSLKKYTDKGERVFREIFYYYICPRCNRDVVEIHRWTINAAGNESKREKELLIGEKASKYLVESSNSRRNKMINYRNFIYSKGIPLRYGKALNDETVRLRYINETAYDGDKIETKVKVLTK